MAAKRKRPKVILCAALTADGKLDTTAPAVLPVLYGGDVDPARHPWAAWYDGAAGILVDARVAAELPNPQAAVRTVLAVRLEELAGWNTAELRAGLLGVLRRFEGDPTKPLLCFGGAGLFRALLDARLADEFCLLVHPVIDGRRGSAALSGEGGAFFPGTVACRLLRMEPSDDQCLLHYRVLRDGGVGTKKV